MHGTVTRQALTRWKDCNKREARSEEENKRPGTEKWERHKVRKHEDTWRQRHKQRLREG